MPIRWRCRCWGRPLTSNWSSGLRRIRTFVERPRTRPMGLGGVMPVSLVSCWSRTRVAIRQRLETEDHCAGRVRRTASPEGLQRAPAQMAVAYERQPSHQSHRAMAPSGGDSTGRLALVVCPARPCAAGHAGRFAAGAEDLLQTASRSIAGSCRRPRLIVEAGRRAIAGVDRCDPKTACGVGRRRGSHPDADANRAHARDRANLALHRRYYVSRTAVTSVAVKIQARWAIARTGWRKLAPGLPD